MMVVEGTACLSCGILLEEAFLLLMLLLEMDTGTLQLRVVYFMNTKQTGMAVSFLGTESEA